MPRLCVIPGDGIGQEVVPEAVRVLAAVIPDLELEPAEAGWACFQRRGVAVPEETLAALRRCRAGLFGAVSSPSRKVAGYRSAILTLRQELDLYANIRPVRSWPGVSPREGVDLVVVRENTEGLYVGRECSDGETAVAERQITRLASQRIAQRAAELAIQSGRGRVTIVHKANVLPLTDGLFRDTARQAIQQVAAEHGCPLEIDELLIDTAAMKMASRPEAFDVVVTTNLFGDILSDVGAVWCGGMGMAPSLNWGSQAALAEPVHGSAPDIAGRGTANPIAAVLSAALLARYACQQPAAAERIERAVQLALAHDLPITGGQVDPACPTSNITGAILARLN